MKEEEETKTSSSSSSSSSERSSTSRRRNEHLPEWVHALAHEEATKQESWPPRAPSREFDWNHPTNEVYFDPEYSDYFTSGLFKQAREKLDYSYHRNPAKSRQELQDVILTRVVQATAAASSSVSSSVISSSSSSSGEEEEKEEQKQDQVVPASPKRRPWIVFSAGTMAVGKGYVMSTLNERGLFPLNTLLHIDPDRIKTELPEMSGYLQKDAATAATKVHRESTQMADILLEHALQQRLPTLVDGSLKDVEYYKSLMTRIRREFPEYQLAILHVTASPEIIRSRAKSRAKSTGRAIPTELLEESIAQVPKSVEALSSFVDVTFTISNEDNKPIQLLRIRRGQIDIQRGQYLGGMMLDHCELSWKTFRDSWAVNIDSCDTERKVMLKHMPSWCESYCPGLCKMASSWKDQKCLFSAKKAFTKAYPSSCARCTIGGDTQCGICIHDKHLCYCEECGSPAQSAIDTSNHGGGHGGSGCSLSALFSKSLGKN